MTSQHEATRTLVKSPPELWAECSDPASLARHLGEFGEITITRLEPESAVAWEGEHASGTVRIEPSGWGTRVTLTAHPKGEGPEPEPEKAAEDVIDEEPDSRAEAAGSVEGPGDSDEEVGDATLEKTLEDEDPLPVADTGRARARWRRLTAVFRRRRPESFSVEAEPAPAEPEAPVSPPPPEPALERGAQRESKAEPESEAQPEAESEPERDPESILASALDSLGQAHHRPFSRA